MIGCNDLIEKSMNVLGWHELCRHLADRAVSQPGKGLCLKLRPETSFEASVKQMELTREMFALMEAEGGFSMEPFDDVVPMVDAARRGETLQPENLRKVYAFLATAGRWKAFIRGRKKDFPNLFALSEGIEPLAGLLEQISEAIDERGNVREAATPSLKRLYSRSRSLRHQIARRLEAFLSDPSASKWIHEPYYTQREGRYVLPVRSDAPSRFDGIVHDISASGATHFMEPRWLVPLNNQRKMAELEIQKEIQRILARLSGWIEKEGHAIRINQEILARIDMTMAKARLAKAMGGSPPSITRGGALDLRGIKHPLLVLSRDSVVENDLCLGEGIRAFIISGPNAGGKTVLLKTLGLAALMARSGLLLAAMEGSSIPYYQDVLADIGDEQDVERDISTYSGHVLNIAGILKCASAGSLVLLDEIAGSTDPAEGAALARAIIETMIERGLTVVITTHYPQLKAMAHVGEGYVNGGMIFDSESMAPTYKLAYGFAGRSSPIEIARRLGLENKVLERAEQLVQGEQLSPEALLSLLERERDGLESEKRRAREAAERMERLADEHERTLERLKEEERRFRLSKKSRLEAEVKQVKARLKEIMKTLAREAAAPAVKEAASTIKRIEDELRVPLKPPSGSYGPIGHLRKGDEVIVLPLGSKGILLEEPRSVKGERLRVQVGNIEVRVKEESLGSLAQGNSDAVQQGPNVRIELRHCPPGRISVEKDLRGMTVEEALNSLEKYLDEVLRSSLKEVRIIHGHGSGALKKAVRDFLKNASYVESFRAADPSEGGDGATMVKLA